MFRPTFFSPQYFCSTQLTYAFVLSLLSLTVHAQTNNQSPNANETTFSNADNNSSTTNNTEDIEVIQVYAQKRAQNINDVSLAVSVIDNESIDYLQIKDSTQLAQFVPNVKMSNNAGEGTTPAFNIRGVGMIDYNTSTISPIAIYSDGVVGGSANNLSVNLFDLENIEVLRGPQGTLFGRNTTGGAILLRSKQPDEIFGGYVNLSLGEQQQRSVDGALNLPVSDNTALRFALNYEDYQYSTNNLMAGQPNGGLKQTNLRVIVKTELDDFTIVSKIHSENWSGKPKPIASLGINRVDGSGLCTPEQAGSSLCMDNFGGQVGDSGKTQDFWDVRADTADKKHNNNSWGANVELTWMISKDITLTSNTGYNNVDRTHSWDSDGAANFIEGSFGTKDRLFSQELTLAIQTEKSYWVTGLYYLTEDIKQNNDIDLFRDFRAIPALAAIPAQFFYRNNLENSSMALYSQFDYPLSDNFVITAGLRYTDESTNYKTIADLDIVPVFIPELWNISGDVDDNEFSGKLALNQKLNKNSSLYYSYSRGYKSGGYNAGYTTSAEQAADSEYHPEKLDAYEIGSKSQFWQQKASLNLAAFYYDYKDQQVFINRTTGPAPYHVLKNAGDSTIYGLEAELKLVPTNDIEFNLNVGYLPKANMGSFIEDDVVVTDNRLPFSSKWNISGQVLYESNLLSYPLISQLGFDYQSSYYFDQDANPYTKQTAFIVWYGRVTMEINDQLDFSLWGKNLTNSEYSELRFNSIAALGAITELKAEARQLGAAMTYRF
jgi:iron complex outermembrane recepter protein